MDYKQFFDLLEKKRMINPIWRNILSLIENELKNNINDDLMIVLTIYFSLVDDGNVGISLNPDILKAKWKKKVEFAKIRFEECEENDPDAFNNIQTTSDSAIDKQLVSISEKSYPEIIGYRKMFEIEDNWLYLKKYNVARKGISDRIKTLFSQTYSANQPIELEEAGFKLTGGQKKAVEEGLIKNLLITGGPGTGKTTSILFILLNILVQEPNYDVYMVAPSGKAASRMKESVIQGLDKVKKSFCDSEKSIIGKVKELQEHTIHRLLGINFETGGFDYGKNKQFKKESIFVIDEASMVDICLFNSILQAIPDGARVFIMGDKNQLPSVECGAVFADLLNLPHLKDNIVELDESVRFSKTTKIYELATAVNNNSTLPVSKTDWQEYDQFAIMPPNPTVKPVYYYLDYKEGKKDKEIIEFTTEKWATEYYKQLQKEFTDLEYNSDTSAIPQKFNKTESGRILCAENHGYRGIDNINTLIRNFCIDKTKTTSVAGQYAGQLMMIIKNNKMLDLYNGDCGVTVTFKDDPTLYFMVRKSSALVSTDGKQDDKIFKMGEFMFYPLRMIASSEIVLSYAITIHKSQGSDYDNIFVILPRSKGHPLLNRQIIYTAITRTKGNTYILSNQERLEEAKEYIITRDTNIQ